MKKHKRTPPLAFAGVSHYVTGNLKTAAREIRKELLVFLVLELKIISRNNHFASPGRPGRGAPRTGKWQKPK